MLKNGHRLVQNLLLIGIILSTLFLFTPTRAQKVFNVRSLGVVGDGKNLDGPIIDKTIKAASTEAVKDGTINIVLLPAGDYRSFTIHGQSNIELRFEKGATLIAADSRDGDGKYDSSEPNQWDQYQDFGHSHWHNSLIVAENVENFSIVGPGLIWGKGLVAYGNESRTREQNTILRNTPTPKTLFGYPNARDAVEPGWANKAIALKNCHKIHIGDGLTISHGGHFAILATGVDDLSIDEAVIDTNRDGIDIDASSFVRVLNTKVNAPNDDAIVLKSSFALGTIHPTENIVIADSQVSGFDEGTLLNGTFKREASYLGSSPNGRIKIGTESNGGFKNIKITKNKFIYSRGLAIETVDGGIIDGVVIDQTTMKDTTNSPIFVRLGNRARGPQKTTGIGQLRNVSITNLVTTNTDSRYSSIISGIPGHPVEGLTLKNINIQYQGGGTKEDAMLEPPEKEGDYPEPAMFGTIPASGFYIRHAKDLKIFDIKLTFIEKDMRPLFVLKDIGGIIQTNSTPLFDIILNEKTKSKNF